MEGMNQATAAPVPFRWKGKEYLVERFSLGEWAYLEDAYVRLMRQRIIQEAKDLQPVLTPEEYKELYQQKLQESLAIKESSNEELQEYVWGPSQREDETDEAYKARVEAYTKTDKFQRGIAFLMSTILNRRYPGEFKYQDVLNLIMSGEITGEHFDEFTANLQEIQGASGNPEGAESQEIQSSQETAQDSATA